MNDFTFNPKLFEISSPPGDTLLETIEAIGMSQAELSLRMGRPLKTINEIIKGKVAITPETALQLERVLGIDASFWNNRERQYRESLARQEERELWRTKTQWLQQIPVKEMMELGWIPSSEDPIEQLENTLGFFGISSPDQWLLVSNAKYRKLESNPAFASSLGSDIAWLRKGEIQAQQEYCEPYSLKLIKDSLQTIRRLTLQPAQRFYPQLKEFCCQIGVVFCLVPELSGSQIRAATRWVTNEKVLIQISNRYQQDDTFWFAFFRAMGHILLHGKRDVFLEVDDGKDQIEENATRFAYDQLVQGDVLRAFLSGAKTVTRELIHQYANDVGVAPGIVVGWLQIEGILKPTQFNDIKRALVWAFPEEEERDEPVPGEGSEAQNTLFLQPPQPLADFLNTAWPGLSSGARQALIAAGYQDEAGRADERLFADWVDQQLGSVESAFRQGFYRDALADIENLIAVSRIGVGRSPALEAMITAFQLISSVIRSSAQTQPEQNLLMLAKQAIVEANRTTQELMVSEARKQYSAVATMPELTRTNNILNKW